MLKDKIIIGISGKKQAGKSTLADYLGCWSWVNYNNNYATHNLFSCCYDSQDRLITQEHAVGIVPSCVSWNHEQEYTRRFSVVVLFSFADYLKRICIDVLGLDYEQCYGSDKMKDSLTKYTWEKFSDKIRAEKTGYMSGRDIMQVMGTQMFREMFDDNVWVDATFNLIKQSKCNVAIIPDVRFPSEVNAIIDNGGYIIRLTRNLYNDNHVSEMALDMFNWNEHVESGQVCVIDNNNISMVEKNKIATDFFSKICALNGLDGLLPYCY